MPTREDDRREDERTRSSTLDDQRGTVTCRDPTRFDLAGATSAWIPCCTVKYPNALIHMLLPWMIPCRGLSGSLELFPSSKL
jgi:hypothetical protein